MSLSALQKRDTVPPRRRKSMARQGIEPESRLTKGGLVPARRDVVESMPPNLESRKNARARRGNAKRQKTDGTN